MIFDPTLDISVLRSENHVAVLDDHSDPNNLSPSKRSRVTS